MNMAKKISIVMGTLLLAIGVAKADTAPSKVAVVNIQQVLAQSPRVAELSKKLESQFKSRQEKLSGEQKNLQDQVDKLNKEAATMSKKDRETTEKKLSDQRAELLKKVVAYQQDLQKEQAKIMQGIKSDLDGIVTTIAKNQSYSLVLDAQAVIFIAGSNDITKDVAEKFNGKS